MDHMGSNSKAGNEVVESRAEIAIQDREDVCVYMSTGSSQILGCKVSVEIYNEEGLEDTAVDLSIDVQEAVSKVLVGMYKLTKKMYSTEYKDAVRLNG